MGILKPIVCSKDTGIGLRVGRSGCVPVRPKEKLMRYAEFRQVMRVLLACGAMFATTVAVGPGNRNVLAAQQQQHQQGHPRQPQPMPPTQSPLDMPGILPDSGMPTPMNPQRVKLFNDDRQKKLVSDVDKLVSLTNELKASLDKTSKDELSLEVIKKASEIERLAHDVQNRMKN